MLRNLEPSSRHGIDLTLTDPLSQLAPSRGFANSTQHAFHAALERVNHQFIEPESVLTSSYVVTPVDVDTEQYGSHVWTASFTSGVR